MLAGMGGGVISGWVFLSVSVASKGSLRSQAVWSERFVLEDPKGHNRARLTLFRAEWPNLVLYDKEGQYAARLGLSPEGEPFLKLYDRKGQTRAVLGYTRLKNRETGAVETRPTSSLVFFSEDGQVIWKAP